MNRPIAQGRRTKLTGGLRFDCFVILSRGVSSSHDDSLTQTQKQDPLFLWLVRLPAVQETGAAALCLKHDALALLGMWLLELVSGAPSRARTCDLLIRSQTLYPTELRVHAEDGATKRHKRHITN